MELNKNKERKLFLHCVVLALPGVSPGHCLYEPCLGEAGGSREKSWVVVKVLPLTPFLYFPVPEVLLSPPS